MKGGQEGGEQMENVIEVNDRKIFQVDLSLAGTVDCWPMATIGW